MKYINYTITTVILIASVILLLSCENTPPPDLGPSLPTHDPGRIVTCKIDGEEWSHGVGWCPMCHSLTADYYSEDKDLQIRARNFLEEPFNNSLNIYIYVGSIGVTSFVYYNSPYSDYGLPNTCNSIAYYPDTLYNNQFYIEEFDTINHKIIGTFEFQVVNHECQDTVLITDGYFDLNPYWHE